MRKKSYSAHITFNVETKSPADAIAFFNQLMKVDCSSFFKNIRIEGEGWQPATQIPTHPEQLLRVMEVKQVGKDYSCHAIFDFDIPHRLVPIAAPWLGRLLKRQLQGTDDEGPGIISFDSSFYAIGYPQQEWEELCKSHGA